MQAWKKLDKDTQASFEATAEGSPRTALTAVNMLVTNLAQNSVSRA